MSQPEDANCPRHDIPDFAGPNTVDPRCSLSFNEVYWLSKGVLTFRANVKVTDPAMDRVRMIKAVLQDGQGYVVSQLSNFDTNTQTEVSENFVVRVPDSAGANLRLNADAFYGAKGTDEKQRLQAFLQVPARTDEAGPHARIELTVNYCEPQLNARAVVSGQRGLRVKSAGWILTLAEAGAPEFIAEASFSSGQTSVEVSTRYDLSSPPPAGSSLNLDVSLEDPNKPQSHYQASAEHIFP